MTESERILQLARERSLLRIRDVMEEGIHPETVRRLHNAGELERVSRGVYTLPDSDITEYHSLAEAAIRVPHGIICLLSALRFHDLTTQAPFEVWMALHGKAWQPADDGVPLRIIRMSGRAIEEGVEEYDIEGIPVRVFNSAKTVADCFKYRNKIGLEVALEALRECWREDRCTMDELWEYARICRVANVMRPYLESLP